MEVRGHRRPVLWTLLFAAAVVAFTGSGGAVTDPDDEDIDPEADILGAEVTADTENVYVRIEMEEPVLPMAPREEEFEIDFTVSSSATSDAGSAPATARYLVDTWRGGYRLFRNYTAIHFADPLDERPEHGTETVTFTVSQRKLEPLPTTSADAHDRVGDVLVKYRHEGEIADAVGPEGTTIPANDADRSFHLLAEGRPPARENELATRAPDSAKPAVETVAANEELPATWVSEPVDDHFVIEEASLQTWMSFTSHTPSTAVGDFDAELALVYPDGTRETIAEDGERGRRAATGVPQKISWELAFTRSWVPAEARMELAIAAEGFFGAGAQGPGIVYYDSTEFDSRLELDTRRGDGPFVTLSAEPTQIAAGETVDMDGEIRGGEPPWTYRWIFDDGNTTEPTTTTDRTLHATKRYERAGTYEPTLAATDDRGVEANASVEIVAGANIQDVRAIPTLPELGTLEIAWETLEPGNSTVEYGTSPGDLDRTVSIEENTTQHSVLLDDLTPAQTYHYRVRTNEATSDLHEATTAGDFTGDSHTVVAYVDTGINPYHVAFQRDRVAHPSTYIEGYPASAQALDLDLDAPTYEDALANDTPTYEAISEGELYWIPGTNVIAAIDKGDARAANSGADDIPLLDEDGHGTAVAGTVTDANPDVLLATIEGLVSDGIGWAANQPWIDVISVSSATLFPAKGFTPSSFDQALANGKLLVYAAGNTPNPDVVFPPPSYPQTISVGGAEPDAKGTEPVASKTPDLVSNFTVEAPTAKAKEGATVVSGTSFAAPTAAGSLSAALGQLREDRNDTTDSTFDGMTSLPASSPYGDDGTLSNEELWDAVNRSAAYWAREDWEPSTTVPVSTSAPWIQMGWGYLGPSVSDGVYTTLTGEEVSTKSAEARTWMAADHAVHQRTH